MLSAGFAVTRVAALLGGTYTALAGMAVRATVRLITAAGTRILVSGRGRSRRFRDTDSPSRNAETDAVLVKLLCPGIAGPAGGPAGSAGTG
ncbi:hypothetical protein Asp14428_66450 [Actinoplanes sp. NBRC 14428]|nr:hypothetical protein Asp14428_66450 [Actinoplanes sp. NBRC 14428]